MAAYRYLLLPQSAVLPDGSASNAAPAMTRRQGTETSPKKHYLTLDFDASTDEHAWWLVEVPDDYTGGGTIEVRIRWHANATSGTCRWGVRIGAVTPDDVDTLLEHAQAAASTAGSATNTTEARRLNSVTISVSNLDSAAAGDVLTVLIYRDADGTSGTDDLAVDAELVTASIRFA